MMIYPPSADIAGSFDRLNLLRSSPKLLNLRRPMAFCCSFKRGLPLAGITLVKTFGQESKIFKRQAF
jgi:hypothetical protein